jgi:hypothetical protein
VELLYGIATILAKLDRRVVITIRNAHQFAKAARELSLHVEKQGETADDTGSTKKPEFAKDPTNEVDQYSIRQNPDGVVLDGKSRGWV